MKNQKEPGPAPLPGQLLLKSQTFFCIVVSVSSVQLIILLSLALSTFFKTLDSKALNLRQLDPEAKKSNHCAKPSHCRIQ